MYAWSYGDGETGSGAVTTHAYGSFGTYAAVVTATNGTSAVTATAEVEVTDAAIAGLSATSDSPTELGSTTTLTASVSAGSNVVYAWSYGDGETGSGAVTAHAYGASGTYAAVVTATNGTSAVTATTEVEVGLGPVSYIVIRDMPGGLGSEVDAHSLLVGQDLVLYAAGYDIADSYISDVGVLWDVTGDLDPVPGGFSSSVTFTPSTGNTTGTITADDGIAHTDATGTITVTLYRVFLPLVIR